MDNNQILYQIYPLGFCDCPLKNDHIQEHRIRKVISWIPHLKQLGITAVLFNPVFQSDTHGYDTIDFTQIDDRLGTNQDFRDVCDALHQAGINILLDAVYNHVGKDFAPFQDVIQKRENSPYRDWFHINFQDTNQTYGFWYEGWEGHYELVKLNLDNPDVRGYLIQTTMQWIKEYGIDGLRIDVAYSINQSFLWELRNSVCSTYPTFFFLGEMINGDYNLLLRNNLMTSVTNYECRKGLYSSMNTHNLFEIAYSLNRQFGPDPWDLYPGSHLLTFADNHDVDRIASTLNDARDLPLVYALMTAMPGIPCIYYGSEWGEPGKRTSTSDIALRPCFDQPKWNSLTDRIAQLNRIRLEYPVFSDGNYRQVAITNEQLAFTREDEHAQLFFLLNIANHEAEIQLPIASAATDLTTNQTVYISNCSLLEAKSFRLYLINK